MKNFALFLFMLAFCASCTKTKPEEPVDPPPVDTVSHIIGLGRCSVLKNGVVWDSFFYAKYYVGSNHLFFIAGKKLSSNGLDERFSISDIPCKLGLHKIERESLSSDYNQIPEAGLNVVLDLDQLLNSYNVDTTRANQYVEVLRYDSVTHVVEGRFQTFLEGPNTWSFLPDSIAMTEGKFHLKIKE